MHRLATVAALVLGGLLVGGCATSSAGEEPLTVGDCLVRADGGTERVGCDVPHDLEVVAVVDTPFDVVPADPTVELLHACAPAFGDYLGPDVSYLHGVTVAPVTLELGAGESVEGTDDEVTGCVAQAPPGRRLEASVADGGLLDALGGADTVARLHRGVCRLTPETPPPIEAVTLA